MQTDSIENGPGALASYFTWLDTAPRGRALAYHLGDLAHDRDPDNFPGADVEKRLEIGALHTLATRVLKDARDGTVKVFQRKHADNVYEYLAVMQRPKREIDPLSKLLRDRERDRAQEPA